jgi:predicted PurR-regulated permease PerM
MFKELLLSVFPQQSQQRIVRVFGKVRRLLSRYFIGILIQITVVMLLEFAGLMAFNVPNALLIAFIGGLLNVIPYLGPLIGCATGCVLTILSILATGMYDEVGWTVVKVISVFLAANIIDNVVNQPLIFSKSVKAHPVEIFVVTICAGYLAGIGGMIIAVPAYTVLRIIMKEYLSEFAFINNLTKNM